MKAFFARADVHWVVVTLFAIVTQYITNNGVDSLTVGAIVHGVYEWYLSATA